MIDDSSGTYISDSTHGNLRFESNFHMKRRGNDSRAIAYWSVEGSPLWTGPMALNPPPVNQCLS